MKRIALVVVYTIMSLTLSSAFVMATSHEDLKKASELNDLAIRKMKESDLDGAESDLLASLEYSDQNPKVKRNLGVIYYEKAVRATRLGNFYEAQRYSKYALQIEPGNELYSKALSQSLSLEADEKAKDGRNQEALILYARAAEFDKNNVSAWTQASHYAWETHRVDLAREYLNKAKLLNPDDQNVTSMEQRLETDILEIGRANGIFLDSMASEHFILSLGSPEKGLETANQVLKNLESVYEEVSYKLNYFQKNKITVVFYPIKEFRKHWKLPYRVKGYYDGKLRIPYAESHTPFSTLRPMIKHELTHAFVSSMTQKPVYQWLNEGLAQWVEGRKLDEKSREALAAYQRRGILPDIERLDGTFTTQKSSLNNKEVTMAYMKSLSLTEYLIERFGILRVVRYIQERFSDDAEGKNFKKHFSGTTQEIQERWIQWLAHRR